MSATAAAKCCTVVLYGKNTRACKLYSHGPIKDFTLMGKRQGFGFVSVPEDGSNEIRLLESRGEDSDVAVSWIPPSPEAGKEMRRPAAH